METEKIRIPLAVPLLTALLALLKLTGVVDWSWVWVFLPMWAPWAAMGLLGLAAVVTVRMRSRR
jgi:hypothetical protein